MNITLNIGFVCTAISPYYAEEYKIRDKSEKQLKKILENFKVKLICFHKTIFTNPKIACSYSGKSGKSGNTGIGEIISSGTDYSMCLWTNFTTFFFRDSQDRLFQSAFLFFAEIAWSLSGTGGNYFRT